MKLVARLFAMLPERWRRAIWLWGAQRDRWRTPWLRKVADWCARLFKNQEGVIQQGVGRGLRFHAGTSRFSYLLGTSEPGIQKAFETFLKPGMTLYDLGANVGFHTVIGARLVGPSGRVIAFEPLAKNAQVVQHNARINGFDHVVVRQQAIGAVDGTAEFLLSAEPTWGRLASLGVAVAQPTGTTAVQVSRLDSLVAASLPLPDFIKIDIEGAETDMLAGAMDTLRRARPVLVIEVHGTNAGVAAAFNELGYASVVFGSDSEVSAAGPEIYVLAAPAEKPILVEQMRKFRTIESGF